MESKERIKDRLMRTAARLWNINMNEIESNFDPIVKLLLDACAYEIEKINIEMEASQSRIIEKLVEVILPDVVIGMKPSTAILHARPVESDVSTKDLQFKIEKKIDQNQTNTQSIHFGYIGQFKLVDAELLYIAASKRLFKIHNYWQKETLYSDGAIKPNTSNELFLGIKINDNIKNLKGLNIYIDYRSDHHKELFYSSLKHVKGFINEEKVDLKIGLMEESNLLAINIEDTSNQIFQHEHKVNKYTYQLYKKNFIHFADQVNLTKERKTPDEILDSLDEKGRNQITPNLLWIKLLFPSSIPAEMLENVYCNLNCYPGINKKKNELVYKSQRFLNVIPLETKDLFFDINSIIGTNGIEYHTRNMHNASDLMEGEAILRSSGVGRFDSREARDVIEYLLQIIRDETSTFSEIGGEMIVNKMKELNQVMARIEGQMKNVIKKGPTHYLLLNSKFENEKLFIEYWTTNGVYANEIKPGVKLQLDRGSAIVSDSIYMITSSLGGRNSMNFEEKINILQKSLLAKERIVSAEDIHILCSQLFGDKIKNVGIASGVMTGLGSSSGLIRTIDVIIFLNPLYKLQDEEKNYLSNELLIHLETNSNPTFPFRIIIN